MARTFLRQDTQVRNSDAYTDNIAPTEAAFETNPTNIQTDLNNLRSQVHNLLKDAAGNWWDDLNVPATLETGLQRGVNNLNTDLHALEKKRVLRAVKLLTDVVVTASTAATGVLTLTANAANTETVTTGSKTYTFQTVLTDVDGNVLIGATASDSIDNLIAAITLGAGSGSTYAASMTANPSITAAAGVGDTMDATALAGGTQGNAVATTEGLANGSWGAATLTSGAGGDVEVLATGELPTQTTAAVGVVTTLGTVVAAAASFLTAGLDEIAGINAMSPKNLIEIVDGTTGDPIVTTGAGQSPAGKKIWALLQGESGLTDGTTITDATTTRVQLSFVIGNATNDDLVLVDGVEVGGKTVNYCYRERVRLEDLVEGDFLNTAAIDIGAGAVTPTRQVSYDNQGTTPVELSTNADLDLAAGVEWVVRDLLNADLFKIIEGSGGGTTELAVEANVDTFRVDAIVNDFDNGASFDTGAAGTTISVGVTANQIDSGGALAVQSAAATDLTLFGQNEVILNDGNMTSEGTWTGPGVKVSETTAEVVAYENAFGGEVSLMNAITQAMTGANFGKVYSNTSVANIAADTNVSGPTTDNNIDTDLGDLSLGDFITDYDVYLNGQLLRGDTSATGANNHDYYPGTSLALGQLKFEFNLKNNDVLAVIKRA